MWKHCCFGAVLVISAFVAAIASTKGVPGNVVDQTRATIQDRPLHELLIADEITLSEMHNILAPHLKLSRYWQTGRTFQVLVEPSDARLMVIGQAVLDRDLPRTLSFGEVAVAGDTVIKGLLLNNSAEGASLLVYSDEEDMWEPLTLEPHGVIAIGDFVSQPVSSQPCGLGECIQPGYVPCCVRDGGGNPDCKCRPESVCPNPDGGGGPNATGCWVSKNGCYVKCGEVGSGYEACCLVDGSGKGRCFCRPLGQCPGDTGSGSNTCSIAAPPPAYVLVEIVDEPFATP